MMSVGTVQAQEVMFEIGPAISYSDGAIIVGQYGIGPINVLGAVWQGERDNYALGLSKRFSYRQWRFDLGGIYAKNKDDRIGTHGNFILFAGYEFSNGVTIGWRHISNGDVIFDGGNNYGREGENLGEDYITIGISCEEKCKKYFRQK